MHNYIENSGRAEAVKYELKRERVSRSASRDNYSGSVPVRSNGEIGPRDGFPYEYDPFFGTVLVGLIGGGRNE